MKLSKFKNEPFTNFSTSKNKEAMEKALLKIKKELGHEYPLVIGGNEIRLDEKIISINPSSPKEVIGIFQKGKVEHGTAAIETAAKTFESWKNVSVEKRVSFLIKAASLIRKKKFEFNAALVYEVGKTWAEADGDTAEAIDFMEFYAREMLRLSKPQPLTKIATEKNELKYFPLGVGIIVPPWNFALAILVGMSTAAIVSGNTVVIKPSSDSMYTGWKFFALMKEIGLPDGVINFITGPGGSVGEEMVKHPQTRFISFTGSRDVGVRINELAAVVHPGQKWLKRVVAEMGGKDSIVIDDKTDLDAAAQATVTSAFGYQGQKCSAASRAIVHEKVYNKFVNLVVEKTKKISVGNPSEKNSNMGPVINKSSMNKILSYIQKGIEEGGELLTGGSQIGEEGFFIQPTVIGNVSPKATIAQEEIFGPVLAIIKAKNFDDALTIANNTEYGLTGGVWTNDRKKIEKAKNEFHVGNFYINRKITGAFVGVHPFGGFNMSGTDSKAGGKDYLLLFTQAKTISEKIK